MNEVRKILWWASGGGAAAFLIDLLVSEGQPLGIRLTLAFLCGCGGFFVGALCAAVFLGDHGETPGEVPVGGVPPPTHLHH